MSSSTTTAVFLSLNDDCMFHIFDRMSLQSLCALSQTNSRLRELTGKHFVRKNRFIYGIINLSDLTFKTSASLDDPTKPEVERYCSFFRRNIQHVQFHKFGFVPGVDLNNVADYIRSNCNPRLRKIEFSYCRLSDKFGEIMKALLEHAETVEFHWDYNKSFSGESGNFKYILEHCHSLKNLSLSGAGVYKEIDPLLLGTYPKLEHFMCTLDAGFTMSTLKAFLRRNSNIKALTWYFWNEDEDLSTITDTIRSMVQLERLYLSFCGYFDLSSICSNLRTICNRKQFNRLELKFLNDGAGDMLVEYAESLESLRCLKGIHMFDVPFPKLPTLRQVTTVQLSSILEQDCDADVNSLPNLEVLYVREMTKPSWTFVQHFIRHSLTLKKIVINSSNLFIGIDAANLNAERQKLRGADEVVIYVDTCYATKTDLKHKLVKIKEVEIEYDHHNDVAPFVSDYVPEDAQIKLK